MGMNHEVRTRRQLRRLLPHEAMWEREATYWRGPGRRRDDDRKHGQKQVCSGTEAKASMSDWQGCLWPTVFSESLITYFFRVYSYCGVERLKFLFALEAWGTMQQICEFGDWEAVFQDEECLMRLPCCTRMTCCTGMTRHWEILKHILFK